jgi:hypothetical protein
MMMMMMMVMMVMMQSRFTVEQGNPEAKLRGCL